MENLGRFKIAVPSTDEQGKIAAYVSDLEAKYSALFECVDSQIQTLEAMKQAMIHEYVTGQRRVGAEDELKEAAYA